MAIMFKDNLLGLFDAYILQWINIEPDHSFNSTQYAERGKLKAKQVYDE